MEMGFREVQARVRINGMSTPSQSFGRVFFLFPSDLH